MPYVEEEDSPGSLRVSPDIQGMGERYGVPMASSKGRQRFVEEADEGPDTRGPITRKVNDAANLTQDALAEAGAAVIGLPGMVSNLIGMGADKLGILPKDQQPSFGGFIAPEDVMEVVRKVIPEYRPQTKGGEYAKAAITGATSGVLTGGGGVIPALAGLGGGLGAKFAGDAYPDNPLAPFLGGVLGGGALGGGYSWLKPSANSVASSVLNDARNSFDRAQTLQQVSRRSGLGNLTAAESLNSPYGLSVQRLIEQAPGGRGTRAVMQARGPAAARASDAMIEALAPGITPRQGAQMVDDAASGFVRSLENARSEGGGPLYKSAFQNSVGIDTTPLLSAMRLAGERNPAMRSTLDKLARDVMFDRNGNQIADLEQIQNGLKVGLDDLIEQAVNGGRRSMKRELTGLKEDLLKITDTSSREFANARVVWSELSKPISEAERSLIGDLMTDRSPTAGGKSLSDLAKTLLNPKNETPADIRAAVQALNKQDPRAASVLVRQYLADKLDGAKNAVKGDPSRLGGRFNAETLGAVELQPRQAANIEAAIRALPDGDRVWDGFEKVFQVYRAQGNRYVPGSPTAYNTAVMQDLKTNGGLGPGGILEGVTNPFRWAGDRIQNFRLRSTYEVLDRVLSSPDSLQQLRLIAREPSRRRVKVLVGAFMGDQVVRSSQALPAPDK